MKTHHSSSSDAEIVIVSFRCTLSLKTQIQDTAQTSGLSNSELIRYSIELMIYLLNNPDICERAGGKLHELIYAITSVRSTDDERVPDKTMPDLLATIERRDVDLHNIKLLNREEHGFDGCRVSIIRHKRKFERYFSEKEYGSAGAALDAALAVRDYVLEQLLTRPDNFVQIVDRAATMLPSLYPRHHVRISRLHLNFS